MKIRITLLVFFVLLPFFMKAKVSFKAVADTVQLEYRQITHIVSVELFESIKTFVLTNGDRETYSSMYGYNPHYSFDGFELYLNPDIGQLNADCDTSKSNFNEIVIRDQNAEVQYYYIRIVREGDIANEQIITYEGMEENKVYLRNSNDHDDLDSMVNYVSQYIEIIKKEVTTNIERNIERFILKQEDLPDFELAFQSKHEGRIYQQWKENDENYSLYLFYYEYKDEYTSIKEISDRSGSFAALYIFGFPNGQILGNSSWTSVNRTAAFVQLWNVGVQIVEPNGEIITNVADKLLSKIRDSISVEYLVKDNELKKHQIFIEDFDRVIGAATDTLADNGFEEFKVEDSKWILNTDSLVMGIRKQWSGENSFFSIDVCEFSSGEDAQQAAEQNANIKGSPFFLIDNEESLETAIEHWNSYWSVYDTIKTISVVGLTGNYAIHFYYYHEDQVDVDFFKSVISKFLNNTAISDVNIDNIAAYPNPSTGFITIAVPPGNGGKYQLRLTDLQGRIVLLKEAEIIGSYKFDLPATKPGIYILEIKNETTAVSKRIVLQ